MSEFEAATIAYQNAALAAQQVGLEVQQATLAIQQTSLEVQQTSLEVQQAALAIQQTSLEVQQGGLEISRAAMWAAYVQAGVALLVGGVQCGLIYAGFRLMRRNADNRDQQHNREHGRLRPATPRARSPHRTHRATVVAERACGLTWPRFSLLGSAAILAAILGGPEARTPG